MGASCQRLRMIAAQALRLAFEKLPFDRGSSLVIALGHKNILKGCDCPQPQIVVPVDMTAQVRDRTFQHWARMLNLSGTPIRDRNVSHQSERLRVIRAEPALIRAQRREHARQIAGFSGVGQWGGNGGVHGLGRLLRIVILSES